MHTEHGLAVAREIEHRSVEALALQSLGFAFATRGDLERAREAFMRCRSLSVETADRIMEGSALEGLATVEEQAGKMEVAEALNREALALWLAIGARHGIASSNYLLGGLLPARGAPRRPECIWLKPWPLPVRSTMPR